MRKCIIIFKNSKIYYKLLIDEEKNVCSFNNQNKQININTLLEKIENIIFSWQPANTTNGIVLDGNTFEIYYQNNNDELLQLKYNSLSMPSNAIDLYKLLEALNG